MGRPRRAEADAAAALVELAGGDLAQGLAMAVAGHVLERRYGSREAVVERFGEEVSAELAEVAVAAAAYAAAAFVEARGQAGGGT